ncbi:PD-(D/E)XK nuclease family protein (plasmid) [Halolamina sp. CBA1230]|uniref:PD-(D/E)XK nuclease family protein n=1 Tax=Halolamina sp. CBA1230 TaxID=1853690 RepID=UPI0009A17593|nr:PD-(D/E)XK nuclease family protein [Halolamina sp. CBA1230]QKY21848.1 PD-(D/E)XK nuclease family protein [Halolamina sp. CBA1230]
MTNRTVLVGPNHHALEAAAFDRGRSLANEGINRVLYVSEESTRHDRVETHWREAGDSLRLRTATLMGLVFDCYEQLEGPTTRLPEETDRRALEFSLDDILSDHSWLSTQPHVSASLVDAFNRRFARFQNVGLTTPERLAAEFSDSSLSDRIRETTLAAYRAYDRYRDRFSDAWHVTDEEVFGTVTDQDLTELLPHVDVVIVDGFIDPTELERQMLEALATSFSTIAILPTFSQSGTAGVDAATTAVRELYTELGFEEERIHEPEDRSPLQQVATTLYRAEPPETQTVPEALEWRELPTPEREIRYVARDIRTILASGIDPSQIGVVIPGLQAYDEYVEDTFHTYDLAYSVDSDAALMDTHVGSAVENLLTLAEAAPRADAVTELVTNPVVDLLDDGGEDAVLTAHRRSDAIRVESMLQYLPSAVTSTLQSLLETLTPLREADTRVADGCEILQTAVADLHISAALDADESRVNTAREQAAFDQVDELLSSFDAADPEHPDLAPSAALNRALRGATLQGYSSSSNDIAVLDHIDAANHAFDHLYIVGLTGEHFPKITRHPAFFERMVEAHPILDVLDTRIRDRYLFATVLANAEAVTLTTPSTDPESTAVVRSPILDELNRTTGIEPTIGTDSRIGSREDLQRAIAPLDNRQEAVNAAGERGDFTASQTIRADRGIACATERASPDLSPRDGLLDPETVADLYPRETREPYSASRVERYVNCGFQFYMENILELEDPADIDRTPDPLEAGTLIHDTLERFFAELQSEPGEPVDISEIDQSELEAHMLSVARSELAAASFEYDGLFYRRWLEQLFAGLGDPAENPYDSDPRPHEGTDKGLFVRFIEHERQRDGGTYPAWFEVPFGDELHDGAADPFAIDLPNGDSVEFHGYIDRIDVGVDDDAPTVQLFDYKTGSTPSMTTTTGGTTFQLPLYLLAAEQVVDSELTDMTDLAATYYKTKPPNDIYQPRGIESKFDSSAELHRFLTDVIPQRLQTLTTSIEQGRFQTTLLTANEANCEYCDYRRSCDVRHHQRRERVAQLEDDSETYVPIRATSTDFASVFSGETDD